MPTNVKTQVDLQRIAQAAEIHVNKPRIPVKFTPEKQEAFLQNLCKNANISVSASNVGVTYSTIKNYQRLYPEFNTAVEEALAEAVGYMEAEVIRRGFEGVDKPVWYQGKQVGTEKQFSDNLALRTLEALAPTKWSSKSSVDIKAKVDVNASDAKNKLLNLLGVDESEIVEGEFTEDG